MAKFRKKPVEAFRFGIDNWPDWFRAAIRNLEIFPSADECNILTNLNGLMFRAHSGDYIVRNVDGNIYPLKPYQFEMLFEPMEE